MAYSVLMEDTVTALGGCGLYQWLLACFVLVGNTVSAWSMLTMAFSGQEPVYSCSDDVTNNSAPANDSQGQCELQKLGNCGSFVYDDDMLTTVSEWDLVCDRKWIVATITTIQMAGILIGCFVAGHIADLIGRKPVFFLALVIMITSNIVAIFSVSWAMYAAVRFIIGVGIAFYMVVEFNMVIEMALSKWRSVICVMPVWALEASLFALLSWGVHDWKKIHIAIATAGAPFLIFCWFVPESFRWLVTQKKFKDAQKVVRVIGRVNGREVPDISRIITVAAEEDKTQTSNRKYTALDLFRSRGTRNTTFGLLFIWFASSLGYYGITFGVKSLSGDLYLNMFLLNIVEVPVLLLTTWLVTRFGRKRMAMALYGLSGVTGIITGVLQYLDNPCGDHVTNVLAIVSKAGVSCGWQVYVLMTAELYPTVVRGISGGVHNTAARVGGMLAPQIVFLDDLMHGILYFISGVLMVGSVFITISFEETAGKVLDDLLDGDHIGKTAHANKEDKVITVEVEL